MIRNFFFSNEKITYITAAATRMDIEESVLASGTLNAFKTAGFFPAFTLTCYQALGGDRENAERDIDRSCHREAPCRIPSAALIPLAQAPVMPRDVPAPSPTM